MSDRSSFPLVSVIIPAYNAERFIAATLSSVLGQTYDRFEVIVVDDGSRDATAAIVRRYMAEDARIRFYQQNNAGVAAARNAAIAYSRGEFIAPIDADDIWYPQNLAKQIACFLRSDERVGLVYSRSLDIDEAGLPTGSFRAADVAGEVFLNLVCHNFIGNASATMFRRSCLDKVGLYNTQMREQNAGGCEDWDLYLRIAERYHFAAVPEFLVGYRRCQGTMSRNYEMMARSQELMLSALAQRHPEISRGAYQCSQSSFYMYFAHLSHRDNNPRQTLSWLQRAYQMDKISVLVRFGFYQLGLVNGWRSRFGWSGKTSVVSPSISIEAVKQKHLKIMLMLWVEKVFSITAPIIFGSFAQKLYGCLTLLNLGYWRNSKSEL